MAKKQSKAKPSKSAPKKTFKKKPHSKSLFPESVHENSSEVSNPIDHTLKQLEMLAGDTSSSDSPKEIGSFGHPSESKESDSHLHSFDSLHEHLGEHHLQSASSDKHYSKLQLSDLKLGIIGAFIGVAIYYAFFFGGAVVAALSMLGAVGSLILSYIFLAILLHRTPELGNSERKVLGFLPARQTATFFTLILSVLLILFLINQLDFANPLGMFNQISFVLLFASLASGTVSFFKE